MCPLLVLAVRFCTYENRALTATKPIITIHLNPARIAIWLAHEEYRNVYDSEGRIISLLPCYISILIDSHWLLVEKSECDKFLRYWDQLQKDGFIFEMKG
jgi:hypothetical protein